MSVKELFENQHGHLTDFALRETVFGQPDELARLEISEHLAFCDSCLARYTGLLAEETLMEAPELFAPAVMRALARKNAQVAFNRYFSVGISACIALVFWVTGVFNIQSLMPPREKQTQAPPEPRFSVSQAAGDTMNRWAGGLSDFFNGIDLRGVFYNEKE